MLPARAFFFLLILLCGCASEQMTHGIPNLKQVAPGVYRGGQPTVEGWEWLRAKGITWDLKLNEWSECPEPWLFTNASPMWIDYEPISLGQQLFGVEDYQMDSILQSLIDRPSNLYIHCEHGQDRTGLVCAMYRVRIQGWSKADAEKEMLTNGFHKELRGLWEFWKRWQ